MLKFMQKNVPKLNNDHNKDKFIYLWLPAHSSAEAASFLVAMLSPQT